jgi:hypothetical protein
VSEANGFLTSRRRKFGDGTTANSGAKADEPRVKCQTFRRDHCPHPDPIAHTRREGDQIGAALFADENKGAGGQRDNVEQKDRWSDVQAES